MNKEIVQIQRFGKHGLIFKLKPVRMVPEVRLVSELNEKVLHHLKESSFFVFDLINIKETSPDFTAFLFEMSIRLLRNEGQLFILNASSAIKNALSEFQPKKYVTMPSTEKDILAHIEGSLTQAGESEFASRSNISRESSGHDQPAHLRSNPHLEQYERFSPTSAASVVDENIIEIPYKHNALYDACNFVTFHARKMGFPPGEISRIKIAVYEGCLNAIEHARQINPFSQIQVAVEKSSDKMQINITDHGKGFEMKKTTNFDIDEAAQRERGGGMGLHIMRRAMDHVDYERNNLYGNRLIMVKYLNT